MATPTPPQNTAPCPTCGRPVEWPEPVGSDSQPVACPNCAADLEVIFDDAGGHGVGQADGDVRTERIRARDIWLDAIVDGFKVSELAYDKPSPGQVWVAGRDITTDAGRQAHWAYADEIEVLRPASG